MKDYSNYISSEDSKGYFILKYVENGQYLNVLVSSNHQKKWFQIPYSLQNKELLEMKMMDQVEHIDYARNELFLDILSSSCWSIALVLAGEIVAFAYRYPNSFPLSLGIFTVPIGTLIAKKNMENNLKKTKGLKDDKKMLLEYENFGINDIDNVLNNIPKKTQTYVRLYGINPNTIDKISYRNYKKILENIKAYRNLMSDINNEENIEEVRRLIERRNDF